MGSAVDELIDSATPERRQRDARTMLALMRRVTSMEPELWGTSVGFGSYHYRYESGREGDAAAASFAPRKAALVVYLLDGVGAHEDRLARLGPHSTGVGCLYLKDLERVDLGVLEDIVTRSWRTLTAGTYTKRARETGQA